MLKGVVHGKTIELEQEPGLPEGQVVTVLVTPVKTPGEGISQSAGGWADSDHELEEWQTQMQHGRQRDRPGLP